ncbi:hypothetical protein GCM10025875_05790 [Litorihabitans aurantiacus]|uniref:Heavy metal transporter n=1 Tax=Litorihabitans aurantiacus TaxID=1930061 RepID=A0AA37XDQ5_9MICO|nr:hypothetical protein GCM10025875_05790 [Litorihabitans aurantiacus]
MLVLAVVAGAGIGGVVLLLRSLETARPLAQGCFAGGYRLDPDQTANAALIVGTTVQRGLPARAGTIGIATAMQESRMRPIDYGDRDSLGMFQQRPSQGWGTPEQVQDPVYATETFFDHLVEVPGYTEMEVTEAAQAVQRSGFPDAYAQHEEMARAFASALTGWSEAELTCRLAPAQDTAGVPEAVVERLGRDLDVTASIRPAGAGEREVVVTLAAQAGDDVDRLAWAVAHAAVAAASETGAGQVTVGSRVWDRTLATGPSSPTGTDHPTWRPRTGADPMPARGEVVISAGRR